MMVRIALNAFKEVITGCSSEKKAERAGATLKIGQTKKGGKIVVDSGPTVESATTSASSDIFASLQTPTEFFNILSTPNGAYDTSHCSPHTEGPQ